MLLLSDANLGRNFSYSQILIFFSIKNVIFFVKDALSVVIGSKRAIITTVSVKTQMNLYFV